MVADSQRKTGAVDQALPTTPSSLADLLVQQMQASESVVVTVHGTSFSIQDEGSYRHLIALVERLQTIEAIREGLRDIDEGRTVSLEEFKAEMQRRHGISC